MTRSTVRKNSIEFLFRFPNMKQHPTYIFVQVWGIVRGLESLSQLAFPSPIGLTMRVSHIEVIDIPSTVPYHFRSGRASLPASRAPAGHVAPLLLRPHHQGYGIINSINR